MIGVLNVQTGFEIERYLLDMFEDLFYGHFRESTEEEDRYQGTDCFIYDIPIDVTLRDGKNNSKFIDRFVLDGIAVNISKRRRNRHHRFIKEVLVIQIETYGERNSDTICELIEDNFSEDLIRQMIELY